MRESNDGSPLSASIDSVGLMCLTLRGPATRHVKKNSLIHMPQFFLRLKRKDPFAQHVSVADSDQGYPVKTECNASFLHTSAQLIVTFYSGCPPRSLS